MNHSVLPEHELFVSRSSANGDSLFVRLLSEYFPAQDRYGRAFDVTFEGCANAPELSLFFANSKTDGQAVYLEILDGVLSASCEEGQEAQGSFSTISAVESDLDEEELKELIKQLLQWYDNESSALRRSRLLISGVRSKISQQIGRLEKKSSNHDATTTAGVLYRQHIEFLGKVLSELDP